MTKEKKQFVTLRETKDLLRAIFKRLCPVAEYPSLRSRMTKGKKAICHPERNEGSSTRNLKAFISCSRRSLTASQDDKRKKKQFVILRETKDLPRAICKRSCPVTENILLRFQDDKREKQIVILKETKDFLRAICKRSCPVAEDPSLHSRMTKKMNICHSISTFNSNSQSRKKTTSLQAI